LVMGAAGGTVDLTAATGGGVLLSGSGASVAVSGNSTWSTNSGSPIFGTVPSAGTVPITIAPGVTLSDSITLANTGGSGGFRVTGGGTLYLTSTNSYASYVTVNQGRLRLDNT